MTDVLWLPIPGHKGRYEVSERGEIRNARTLKTLKCFPDRNGYLSISLIVNGRNKTFKAHRLVCEAFHGPAPESMPEVDHDNRIRSDNRSSNLKWSTVLDNRPGRVAGYGESATPGVSITGRRFRAFATVAGKYKHIGSFSTIQEAAAARVGFVGENKNV